MISINRTLLNALFLSPNPQPQKTEVGTFFKKLRHRIFPTEKYFIEYLQAQAIDKQYELAANIIQSLCFYANFPPPFYALKDVLYIEKYQNNLSKSSDPYIPRDHFLHIVNLYILGIYVFFYNSEFYSKIVFDNLFARQNGRTENSKVDCIKDFISEWKYFCLFHDVGYTAELLGNKLFDASRNDALEKMKKIGFRSSFASGKPIEQMTFLGTIEIMAKEYLALMVSRNSNSIINSKHRLFKNIRLSTFHCYDSTKSNFTIITMDDIAYAIDHHKKLERVYTNHCLKVLLPIIGTENVTVIGFTKDNKQIVFFSYCNGRRKTAVQPGYEDNTEIKRIISDPELVLFDDFILDFEIEYYIKTSENEPDGFAVDESLKRSYITVKRELEKKFLAISTEQQFLDYQYEIFSWLNKRIEPHVSSGSLKEHLDSWKYGLNPTHEEIVIFNITRSQKICEMLKDKYIPDINTICFDYLKDQVPRKKPKYKSRKPKNAAEMLEASVDLFYNYLKATSNNEQIKTALLENARVKHLEMLEDDISLLERYSALYVKLFCTLNKTKTLYSYDYTSCKTKNSPFLNKCINEKTKLYYNNKTTSEVIQDYKLQYGNTADHGIASAQYASSVFEIYRNALKKAEQPDEIRLLSVLFNIFGDFSSEKQRYISNYDHIFEKTLLAIFVHNLYPSNFKSEELSKNKTTNREPLSYFALICDALQQWNRPHSLFPAAFLARPNDDTSEEYNILISQNHISIHEQDSTHAKNNIKKTIETMATYIANADAYISLSNS